MNKHLHFFITILSFLLFNQAMAQGVIVNEYSNGPAGSEEFIELLVVGSTTNPTTAVDLTGWVIDDNNGDFAGLGTSVGIASGHFRFTGSCFTAVPPGSLIVLYNGSDPNPSLPADDPNDANGDCVYVIPHNSSCLERCTALPSSANSSYAGCTPYVTPTSWSQLALRNGGDAVQTRRPDFSFYHGYSYGDVGAPFPTFPTDFGSGSSFRVQAGSGSGHNYYLGCGDWTDNNNFIRGNASSDDSPGAANTANNQILIDNIKVGKNSSGSFDYANLANPDNCLENSLPVYLHTFKAAASGKEAKLRWTVTMDKGEEGAYFEIQRSMDAIHFESVGYVEVEQGVLAYTWKDEAPMALNYYRLKIFNADGSFFFSPIRAVNMGEAVAQQIVLYPNPVQDVLTVRLNEPLKTAASLKIIDVLGRTVQTHSFEKDAMRLDLPTSQLERGNYFLYLRIGKVQINRRFVKQ